LFALLLVIHAFLLVLISLDSLQEIYQDNFPARLYKSIQINSPMILKMMWGLFKPFVKAKILERFFIGSKEDIQQYVDKEFVWSKYGGGFDFEHEDWVAKLKDYAAWYAHNKGEADKAGATSASGDEEEMEDKAEEKKEKAEEGLSKSKKGKRRSHKKKHAATAKASKDKEPEAITVASD